MKGEKVLSDLASSPPQQLKEGEHSSVSGTPKDASCEEMMGLMEIEEEYVAGASSSVSSSPIQQSSLLMEKFYAQSAARPGVSGDEDSRPFVFLGEVHPLHNPLVLAKVFDYCNFQDLANCRVVCSQWHDLSLSVCRSNSALTFSFKNGELTVIRQDDPSVCVPVHQFMEFANSPRNECDSKPYTKFQLVDWQFNLGSSGVLAQDWSGRFLELLGNVTTLTLSECNFNKVEIFRKIVYIGCPSLQRLTLSGNTFAENLSKVGPENSEYVEPLYGEHELLRSLTFELVLEEEVAIPVSWLEFLSHFPSLTTFKLSSTYVRMESPTKQVLRAMKIIRTHDPAKLPITKFDVDDYFTISRTDPEVFGLLRDLNFPQERLFIVLENGLRSEVVRDVLEFHSATLGQLTVQGSFKSYWNFPCGVKLEKLHELWMPEGFCKNMEFLKYTPNIRELSIVNHYQDFAFVENDGEVDSDNEGDGVGPKKRLPETAMISLSCQLELDGVQLLNLTEFRLDAFVSEGDVRRLVNWFPNVTRLVMKLSDSQFAIICEHWRSLVSLKVLGVYLTDVGITGRGFQKPSKNQEGAPTKFDMDADEEIRPNISLLQSLESFGCQSVKLTDASVFLGFLELPRLRMLTLVPAVPIKEATKEVLRKRGTRACF